VKDHGLLHDLHARSAERAPQAVAVRHGDDSLTYAELTERTHRLARLLVAEGVRPGEPVVLHLRKSVHAVVGLLAVLEAGACCVPVEPGTPAPRLRDVLDQCSARMLIGSRESCEKLDSEVFAGCTLERTLELDGEAASAAGAHPAEPPGVRVGADDLAYVLFTSGSTGHPKGVELTHRNVRAFVDWAVEEFRVGPEDRLSNHAPFNFDLSTFDLYGALSAGASVTLLPEGLSMFPTRLAELVERERLTVWYSVPSVLTLLVARGSLSERDLGSLRVVLFAGEVFPVKYLRDLMLALPQARYANLFGPTETNVCTWYEVAQPPGEDDPPVPIGRACPYARTVVMDEGGAVVSGPGREGVLHVGGASVMRGYFRRPEETEAAFVAGPDGERLYCTGDWVTWDADGNYLFRGRRDHMVKSGGYRIELGEIEAALHAHPGIEEAVAIPVPDDLLGSRIRAVVVPAAAAALDEQLVRRHCAERLPRYMVPAEVEFREDLPRTPTEKVDRARLATESIGTGGGHG
jgi:amino acid adenylation domain-containing protein